MIPEKTIEEQMEDAIKDVHDAMIANIHASKLLIDITKQKDSARYALLKAKERLSSLEMELMQ